MGFQYLILGAGRQGTACAYDLVRFGGADRIVLGDANGIFAKKAVGRLRSLLPSSLELRLEAASVLADNRAALVAGMRGMSAVISAVPYYLNPGVAEAAVEAGVPMSDLGGDIGVVWEERRLSKAAAEAGISIIPDCGLAPGLNNILAVHAMSRLDRPRSVRIYCGGLPRVPRPPLEYLLVFNLEGMLNNYFGKAYVLRGGKVTEIESFSELEEVVFPKPLGRCEAFVTAGATSTSPWTFEGRLESYDYKTVRYPGHYEKIKLLRDLGLLETRPVNIKGTSVSPRDLFVKSVGDRIAYPEDRDLVILRVSCRGKKGRRAAEARVEILEFHDPVTGFSAMERTTGYSTGIVAAMQAKKEIRESGVLRLEEAVPPGRFVEELGRRGIRVRERMIYEKAG